MQINSLTRKVVLHFQLQDDDVISSTENPECISKQKGGFDDLPIQEEIKLVENSNPSNSEKTGKSMKVIMLSRLNATRSSFHFLSFDYG